MRGLIELTTATSGNAAQKRMHNRAIAHILKECKDCKEDHVENCIINIVRNCYEVGLFGDIHDYEGSALQYLMYLKEKFPEHSEQIAEIYMK